MVEDNKKCKCCNGEIPVGRRGNPKFCSDKCRHEYYNSIAKKNRHLSKMNNKRICKYCEEEIPKDKLAHSKFCSDKCRYKYHNKIKIIKNKKAYTKDEHDKILSPNPSMIKKLALIRIEMIKEKADLKLKEEKERENNCMSINKKLSELGTEKANGEISKSMKVNLASTKMSSLIMVDINKIKEIKRKVINSEDKNVCNIMILCKEIESRYCNLSIGNFIDCAIDSQVLYNEKSIDKIKKALLQEFLLNAGTSKSKSFEELKCDLIIFINKLY